MAFLSDCETCALVAPSGNVEWMCLPRFDSPSVFGSLLDRRAGSFRFGPDDVMVPAARRYLPGTMVLETSWGTTTGWIIVRDVLLIGPWHHEDEMSHTHRRAPTDYDADHVLLRTVRCVNGEVQLVLQCEPRFDYGRESGNWSYAGQDYHEAIAESSSSDVQLRLTTDMRLGFEGPRALARTLMKEGDTRFCALSWSEHEPPRTYDEAYKRLRWTAHHWQHWLARGNFPDHPWRTHLERSALTLKGLTYAPTGALVAAATTSLPETPGGERNWDYRYTWIRDSTFALWALYTLGFDWEANDFFCFIADVAERDEDLQIMYGIGGERDLTEQILEHLDGYLGSRPVRIGNGALQPGPARRVGRGARLGVHPHQVARSTRRAAVADPQAPSRSGAAQLEAARPRHLGGPGRAQALHVVEAHVLGGRRPRRSAGADPRRARAGRRVAEGGRRDPRRHPRARRRQARRVHAALRHRCARRVGAAHAARSLPAARRPRIVATVYAIADELTVDGLVLRYLVKETDDGLSGEEGSFTICSFWLVSALVEIGDVMRARQLCEKLLSFASPLGLYAEEIDPHSGRHLGNFPQAFTHLALINAVIHLIRADGGAPLGAISTGVRRRS